MTTIQTYKQRAAAAKEARERYTVDNGQRCTCSCGNVHYVKREVKQQEAEKEK